MPLVQIVPNKGAIATVHITKKDIGHQSFYQLCQTATIEIVTQELTLVIAISNRSSPDRQLLHSHCLAVC
jgi:hypothetical protein